MIKFDGIDVSVSTMTVTKDVRLTIEQGSQRLFTCLDIPPAEARKLADALHEHAGAAEKLLLSEREAANG